MTSKARARSILLLVLAACDTDTSIEVGTSTHALAQSVTGTYFFPPLGAAMPPTTGTFDGSLLARIRFTLESTAPNGQATTTATFSSQSTPAVTTTLSRYRVFLRAGTYFTNPTHNYRVRVALDGQELGFADVPAQIHQVAASNPNFMLEVAVRTDVRPVPSISSISPISVETTGAPFTLTVTGTDYSSDTVIRFGGQTYVTRSGGAGVLLSDIPSSAYAAAGDYPVVVFTPNPGGGTSNTILFTAVAPPNPVPVISAVDPAVIPARVAPVSLRITGTAFGSGSSVLIDGIPRQTTLISPTELRIDLSFEDVANARYASVLVRNPTPGGGDSQALMLTIENPVPELFEPSPLYQYLGFGETVVTLSGRSFAPNAVATVSDLAVETTFISESELSIVLPEYFFYLVAAHPITVANPSPGGGDSETIYFYAVPMAINEVTPNAVPMGSGDTLFTATGAGFLPDTVVYFNGYFWFTTYYSPELVTFTLPGFLLGAPGDFDLYLFSWNVYESYAYSIVRVIVPDPPLVTAVEPMNMVAGAGAVTLIVRGTFAAGDRVYFGATQLATTFVSSQELSAVLPASLSANAGSHLVTARNAGGSSAAVSFVVYNPSPSILALSPASATFNESFTLTVDGERFAIGAVVNFNGVALATTRVSSTQLTANVPASAVTPAVPATVVVSNPEPSLGASASFALPIINPTPAIASLSPASRTAGFGIFTLTVNGSNFVPGAVVRFGGTSVSSTFVSSTSLTASIPSALTAIGGPNTAEVSVENPAPGMGNASAIFTINNRLPNITSLYPPRINPGSAEFTLVIQGSVFLPSATVAFNSIPLAYTYVSANRLEATVPAALVATLGRYDVVVSHPAPVVSPGFDSEPFDVAYPTPVITSLSPSNTAMGATSPATVTVYGSNFSPGAYVTFNGVPQPTTFVTNTRVTVAIAPEMLVALCACSLTVSNPEPEPATSAPAIFNVVNPDPVLSSLSTYYSSAQLVPLTITLSGSAFVPGSVARARLNSVFTSLATTFIDSNLLQATIPGELRGAPAVLYITVLNPTPGGGTSNERTIVVEPHRQPSLFTMMSNATCTRGAGNFHDCVGSGSEGQQGDGTQTDHLIPARSLIGGWTGSGGFAHACVLASNDVYCWGRNTFGSLGDGTTTSRSTPRQILSFNAIDVDAMPNGACAIRSDGTLWCWGDTPTSASHRLSPFQETGISGAFQVAAGGTHVCVRNSAGAVSCIGANDRGQLGAATAGTAILGLIAMYVDAGDAHSCAIRTDRTLACWGANEESQLGAPAGAYSMALQNPDLNDVVGLSTGERHTCAIVEGGDLYCWGNNTFGQVGDGTFTTKLVPTHVLSNVEEVAAGMWSTCARLLDGSEQCWGYNDAGQLGTGSAQPQMISSPTSTLF